MMKKRVWDFTKAMKYLTISLIAVSAVVYGISMVHMWGVSHGHG